MTGAPKDLLFECFPLASYPFGYNGKMKDNEIYGSANAYDFGARIFDPRICRWLSVDPLMKKYSNLSPYNAYENNPVYFTDPTGKGAIPTVIYNEKGEPVKVVVSATIYVYTDDNCIDINQAATQIQTEINTELNQGFNARVVYEKPSDKDPNRMVHATKDVPIEFDVTVVPLSTDDAVKKADENVENMDWGANFLYVHNQEGDPVGTNTARGGNSGIVNLSSLGKVKAHEFLHFLGFSLRKSYLETKNTTASHWPDEDSYSNRLMFGAATEKYRTNAKATQDDVSRINFGQSLEDCKGFGTPPLNNIYNQESLINDSYTPINTNRTNGGGNKTDVYND